MASASAYKPKSNNKQTRVNDIIARTMQWRGRSVSQLTDKGWKGDMGRIKGGKAHTQAMPNPKKKWDADNEDLETHSRHKS